MERRRAQPGTAPSSSAEAWALLAAGNARFMAGASAHPHQGVQVRHRLAQKQRPFAMIFGCADSRVGAELIFDQGLGDLFVVRTAGQVTDASVLGSIEFGVGPLGIPLIVVLGHESCGAVKATLYAHETGEMPGGFLRDIVERVTPSVVSVARSGEPTPSAVGREHVRMTVRLLAERSALLAERVAAGRLAVVGAEYALADGEVSLIDVLGDLGPAAAGLRAPAAP